MHRLKMSLFITVKKKYLLKEQEVQEHHMAGGGLSLSIIYWKKY